MFRTKITLFNVLQANLFVNSDPIIKDNVMYITSNDDLNNSMLIQKLAFENRINHIVIDGDTIDSLPRMNYLYNITEIDILAQKIKNIPENCFSFCNNLTKVRLNSNIAIINANAFYSSPISEINLENVKEIHDSAFKLCPNLIELNIPSIQLLGNNVTESSGIQTVKLGENLTDISDFAFFNCRQLYSIQFSKNLEKIGNGVFMLCQNLTELNFEATNLQSIGSYSFYGLNIKKIMFPNTINEIGSYSFAYSSISSLDFLTNLSDCYINEYSFAYCNEIKSVIINSETNINDATGMFYCCSNLENITLKGKNLDIPMNFAYCCSKLTNLDAKYIKKVEYKAFYMCFNLKSVNLMNCILISFKSFSNCYKLNVTAWPRGTLYLAENCFEYCSSLDLKIIPDGYSVQQKAFIGCTAIRTLLIKSFRFDLQTRIGGHFIGCSNLVNVTFDTYDMYAIPCNCFYKCISLERITLPLGCTTILENAFAFTNLKQFDFTDVTYICQSAFEGSSLTNIIFNDDLTIDNFAFKNCKSLKKVIFNFTTTEFNSQSFIGCDIDEFCFPQGNLTFDVRSKSILSGDLKNLISSMSNSNVFDVPSSVNKISTDAFPLSSNISVINIDHYVNLDDYSFSGLNVTKINFDIKVTEKIDSFEMGTCFAGLEKLEVVNLPKQLNFIPKNCFLNCKSLKKVDLTFVKEIRSGAFENCFSLSEIIVSNHLESIDSEAFKNCHFLRKFDIPNSVYEIGFGCFQNCIVMNHVTIGNGLQTLNSFVFSNTSISNLFIPKNVLKIDKLCFYNSKSIQIVVPNDHPLFRIEDNALISKYDDSLILTFGKLPKIYKIPESVKILTELSLQTYINDIVFNERFFYNDDPGVGIIKIPKTVEIIDENAFASLNYLFTICYEGEKSFDVNFADNNMFENIYVNDNFSYDSNNIVKYKIGKCKSDLPDSFKMRTFTGMTSLEIELIVAVSAISLVLIMLLYVIIRYICLIRSSNKI